MRWISGNSGSRELSLNQDKISILHYNELVVHRLVRQSFGDSANIKINSVGNRISEGKLLKEVHGKDL